MAKKMARVYIFLIVFAIVAVALAVFFYNSNSNNVLVEGVLVSAGSSDPFTGFSSLSKSSSFIVSPQMHEPVGSLEQYMFNGAALFIQVLQGNQKEIVQVIRVFNSQNEMIYCSTNFGDVKTEQRLSVQECNDLLGSEGKTAVLVQFPDGSQWQPIIELGEKKITIKPRSYEDIGSTCFLALRIMYTNAGDVINASNLIVGRINQGTAPNGTDANKG
jgi:hypothetical protein